MQHEPGFNANSLAVMFTDEKTIGVNKLPSEVLGISEAVRPDVYAGVSLLRRMLCQEPSINGGKRL